VNAVIADERRESIFCGQQGIMGQRGFGTEDPTDMCNEQRLLNVLSKGQVDFKWCSPCERGIVHRIVVLKVQLPGAVVRTVKYRTVKEQSADGATC
jgi:sulfur relay (sulfurtransferase) complex TusBCD TusD component (DsrE family)